MAYTPQIYYPSNYQPQYQMQQPMAQPQMPQQQPQQQNNNSLIWVSGEVGAKSYLVCPGTTVLLMDSEGDRFFLKTTDNAGMPTLRTFEYKEVTANAPQGPNTQVKNMNEQFVTREEYNELSGKYDSIVARIEELQKPRTTVKKKEAAVDE